MPEAIRYAEPVPRNKKGTRGSFRTLEASDVDGALREFVSAFREEASKYIEKDLYVLAKIEEFCRVVGFEEFVDLLDKIHKFQEFDVHMVCGSEECYKRCKKGSICEYSERLCAIPKIELILVPGGVERNIMMVDTGKVILDVDFLSDDKYLFEGPIYFGNEQKGRDIIADFNRLKKYGYVIAHNLTSDYSDELLEVETATYLERADELAQHKGLYVAVVGERIIGPAKTADIVEDLARREYGNIPVLVEKIGDFESDFRGKGIGGVSEISAGILLSGRTGRPLQKTFH